MADDSTSRNVDTPGASQNLDFPTVPLDTPLDAQPRYLGCGYVPTGLGSLECPLNVAAGSIHRFYRRTCLALFQRWEYWRAGLFLAGGGALVTMLLLKFMPYGHGVVVELPIRIDAILGHGVRVHKFLLVLVCLGTLGAIFFCLVIANVMGVFCGLIIAGIFLAPVLFGSVLEYLLRVSLKNSRCTQRGYLPMLWLLMLPCLVGTVEAFVLRPGSLKIVATSCELETSRDRAWESLMSYEQVKHNAPALLRLGLPPPLYTAETINDLGHVRVRIYTTR